jgi:hypothetical protein
MLRERVRGRLRLDVRKEVRGRDSHLTCAEVDMRQRRLAWTALKSSATASLGSARLAEIRLRRGRRPRRSSADGVGRGEEVVVVMIASVAKGREESGGGGWWWMKRRRERLTEYRARARARG